MYSLGRDSKTCARERSRIRDEEGINTNQLTMCVNQRTTGVARVDGCVGLNEVARLARIIRVRIGPIDRADDSAERKREISPKGLPMANTDCPGTSLVESPQPIVGRSVALILTTAKDPVSLSVPITLAGKLLRSCRVTRTSIAPSTT